ncbi:heat shock protein [Angomonas deanei]|nr:heat shock protein [Angomonas deanei]|eukprot:EPY36316.1 heat shock protein [Angomonas deanei]
MSFIIRPPFSLPPFFSMVDHMLKLSRRALTVAARSMCGVHRLPIHRLQGAILSASTPLYTTYTSRRLCSSGVTGSDRTSAEFIVSRCKWQSGNLLERLGMSNDEAIDEAKVRHHFQVLSKHFHPDLPDAPENAAEAFRNIREAYVQVLEQVKRHGPYAAGEAPHFVFMDQAQRSAKVAAMGEGVIFFVLLLLVYAFLVARHNRKRVRASLLAYLLAIFVVVQIFPRVLSAVVLFAWMSDIRVTSKELEEQAALTILVEKSGENMIVKLAGIAEEDQPDVKVSVKVTRTEKAKGGMTTRLLLRRRNRQ